MILDAIAASTRKRVEAALLARPLADVRRQTQRLPSNTGFPFERALSAPELSFICEVKKASPSKGIIADVFPYLEIAKDYERAGASAVSVLTEPEFFLGSDRYLSDIVQEIQLPVLRKDFIVDSYQIYEAKLLGASAVLLICALLDLVLLKEYIDIAHSLGLSALVETHSEAEVDRALSAGGRVIGVNNRDLKTFTVDLAVSERLGRLLPEGALFVSESGLRTREDVERVRSAGADAVLIGETLMRAPDRQKYLAELKADV